MILPDNNVLQRIFSYLHPGQIGPSPIINYCLIEDVNMGQAFPDFPHYHDLVAVNETCRLFHHLSSHCLYKDVTITDGTPEGEQLMKMLLSKPYLQGAIRHLRYSPRFWSIYPYAVDIDSFIQFINLAFHCANLITMELDFGANTLNQTTVFALLDFVKPNQLGICRLMAHNPEILDFFNNTSLQKFICSAQLSDHALFNLVGRLISNPHLSISLTTLYLQIQYDVQDSVLKQFSRIANHCHVLSTIHLDLSSLGLHGLFDFFDPYLEIITMLSTTDVLPSLEDLFVCPTIDLRPPDNTIDMVKLLQTSMHRLRLKYIHIAGYRRCRVLNVNGIRIWKVISKVRGMNNLVGGYSALESPYWKIAVRSDFTMEAV